jgi:pyrroloquinoline quinone biosynthesis protein E
LPLDFPSVRDEALAAIWRDSAAFNAFRGDGWMPEPCRSCPDKTKDFGGCRCQAFALTGDAGATDPACSRAPRHELVRQAVERAARSGGGLESLIPRGPGDCRF